jgi:hypothetical protein
MRWKNEAPVIYRMRGPERHHLRHYLKIPSHFGRFRAF